MRSLSIINMHLLDLIKTSYRHSYNEIIHNFTAYGHNHQNKHIHIFQYARGKTLIINNTRGQATVERGTRFHPMVGLATPSIFTTSHPRAKTTML
jgi:hypothetical protein